MNGLWRKSLRALGSPKLALGLLLFVGAWSLIATAVPQGVQADAGATGPMTAVARATGLDHAFSSPLFVIAAALLALSTGVCSWGRTKLALSRARTLRDALRADARSVSEGRHDLSIACSPGVSDAEALATAGDTLRGLGIRTRIEEGVLRSVSPRWAVWGSPVFHWALFALIVAAFAGTLVRFEGTLSVPVGATVSDVAASYSASAKGLLAPPRDTGRRVRVDAFDPDYVAGGIDRGAVPTVSVLDRAGTALVKQRVYPNRKLHSGTVSMSAPGCGLAVDVALIDPTGREVSKATELVDFAQDATATGGTVPLNQIALPNTSGGVAFVIRVTVPLERSGEGYGEWIPRDPRVRVQVTDGSGTLLGDKVVRLNEAAELPGGGSLKPLDIGWYARLSVVDDPTVPVVYAAMVLASLGLTLSVAAPQRLVVAVITHGPDGSVLAMRLRLWRNNPTSRAELERELSRALAGGANADVSAQRAERGEES